MSSEENSDDRPITVGVIDDDPMICQAMRLLLEDYSTGRLNVVFTCTAGGQAVDEAGRHHPDVVLMDMKMPVMDGLEATRQIREAGSSVPIIAVTAYAYDSDRAKALDVGCDDYIAKPLTGDVLKKKLRKHLKR